MININLRNISFKNINETNKCQKYSYITTNTELQYRNSECCITGNEAIKIISLVTDLSIIKTIKIGLRTFLLCNDIKIGYIDFNKINIFIDFVNFDKVKKINNIESFLKN